MATKSKYKKKLEYNNMYNRMNYRSFSMRLSRKSEAEIIDWLEKQEGVKEYLLDLVEADMKKNAKKKSSKKSTKKSPKK